MYQHVRQLSLRVRDRLSIGRRRLCRYVENICSGERFATVSINRKFRPDADVDECVEDTPCKERDCINTVGSYRCGCSPGFRPRGDDCIGKYIHTYGRDFDDVSEVGLNVVVGHLCPLDGKDREFFVPKFKYIFK